MARGRGIAGCLLALRLASAGALELGCQEGTVAQQLYLLNVTHSNLGGRGPDTTPPNTLRFDAVLGGADRGGECVALEVSRAEGSKYQPESAELNGAGRWPTAQSGDARPGQVSVKGGSRADLVFRFLHCGTSEPAALPRFNLTFYSPHGASDQKITASGYDESLIVDARLFTKSYTDEGTAFHAKPGGCSSSADQKDCSFTLHFRAVHEFMVVLEAGESTGKGNLVEAFRFSGAACGPPPTPKAKGGGVSPCSAAVCGSGYELLPKQQQPLSCKGDPCFEDECCRVAKVEGAPAPQVDVGSSELPLAAECSGKEQQWHVCGDLPACEKCEPEDCKFSEWSDWSAVGGCSGLCQRDRKAGKNNECGKPCSGPSVETVVRLHDAKCFPEGCRNITKDCAWSEWSDWSECQEECEPCRLKQSFRERRIATPAHGGGRDCEGVFNQTRPCQASHDKDCELSAWGEWTDCSKSCGIGWKQRMRRVVQEAKYGGRPCSGSQDEGVSVREIHQCNVKDCAKKMECEMSDWSDWEGCGHKHTQQFRHREIAVPPMNGAVCNHEINQTVGCPGVTEEKVNCTFSDWDEWSGCENGCNGQRYRSRNIDSAKGKSAPCVVLNSSHLQETKPCDPDSCKADNASCKMSDWTQWGVCKGDCGQGISMRLRHVETLEKTSKPCEAALQEVRPCDTKRNCTKVDCAWAAWEDWSECTASCGGGTKRRSRAVQTVPKYGGEPCSPEAKVEVVSCGERTCDKCIDGTWRPWSDWGNCSGSCYPAYKARHRDLQRQPNFCGKPAAGLEDEYVLCKELPPCQKQQDCELSDWGDWSGCAVKCFGVRERLRHVKQMATLDGKQCTNESLKEVEPCNPGPGEEAPADCGPDAPESCTVGEWGEWTECSAKCDGGQRNRQRNILSPAANGGSACKDDMVITASCGMEPCNKSEVCQDCEWGHWSGWSACSCDGQRVRHRSVAKLPTSCGKPCKEGSGRQTEACVNKDCDNKFYCAWSSWTSMGDCSATCGSSTRMRQRSLTLSTAGDSSYLFVASESSPCNGNQIKVQKCPFTPCEGQCRPVDCQFGAWADWSEPSCDQLCTRKREVDTEGACGGSDCDGPLLETKPCHKACFKPVDCKLSEWSTWNTTDCDEGGQKYRTRDIKERSENGGKPCDGPMMEAKACAFKVEPKVDCKLADWRDWTACTEPCGGGITTRSREVVEEAAGGGMLCSGELDQIQQCNMDKCATIEPCKFGEWSEWSGCEDDGTTRYRAREIEQFPTQGGSACAGALRESEACSQDVDCQVSAWTTWDACDKSCGGGQQARQRFVQTTPRGGGRQCPPALVEVRGCAEEACEATDCTVSDWSEWGGCSASCGSGARNRTRSFTRKVCDGGAGCDLNLAESGACHGPPCKCKECKWGKWAEWSACSAPCNGGQRTRQRGIEQTPEPGCKPCSAEDKEEMEACNTQSCQDRACEDGEWAEWGEWEACSSSCEGGWTWRSRLVKKEANDCGRPALGAAQESKKCNTDVACEPNIDCEFGDWSAWGDCSATCGGVKRRKRSISKHGSGTGKECVGPLQQAEPCQDEAGLLDWHASEHYLELGLVSNNNLGYAGPGKSSKDDDRLSRPPNIRFERALVVDPPADCKGSGCDETVADLVIFPKSPYTPCDVSVNGKQGPRMGVISVQSASRVDLEFALVNSQTGSPVKVESLALKFFDLDQGKQGESSEVVSADGFKEFRIVHGTGIVFAENPQSGQTMFHAGSPAVQTEQSPQNASDKQERRAVTLVYSKVSKVDVSLEVSPGSLCQAFVFATRACAHGCPLEDSCSQQALPVDCQYSDWSSWGDCAATCGSGQHERSRSVIQEAAGGGAPCSGALSETAPCDNQACPGDCQPTNCAWGDWGDWGKCDRCGGQMTRARKVAQQAKCGGSACESGAAAETANCTRICHGRTWCVWDDWQAFGPCSATCGQGLRSRERHLKPSDTPPAEKAKKRTLLSRHAYGLEGKFSDLKAKAQSMEANRLQMLALAFVAGPSSVAALFLALRTLGRRRTARLVECPYAPVFGSSPDNAGSRARLLEWAPRIPQDTEETGE